MHRFGIGRDNPSSLLEMPIQQILWLYDISEAWQKEMQKLANRK